MKRTEQSRSQRGRRALATVLVALALTLGNLTACAAVEEALGLAEPELDTSVIALVLWARSVGLIAPGSGGCGETECPVATEGDFTIFPSTMTTASCAAGPGCVQGISAVACAGLGGQVGAACSGAVTIPCSAPQLSADAQVSAANNSDAGNLCALIQAL